MEKIIFKFLLDKILNKKVNKIKMSKLFTQLQYDLMNADCGANTVFEFKNCIDSCGVYTTIYNFRSLYIDKEPHREICIEISDSPSLYEIDFVYINGDDKTHLFSVHDTMEFCKKFSYS